jgi:hypothetical protein
MELEIEAKVTLHHRNDHFLHQRRLIKLEREDIDGEWDEGGIKEAFDTTIGIISNSIWDALADDMEALDD